MADDLGDEWWIEEKQHSKEGQKVEDSKQNGKQNNNQEKQTKKRAKKSDKCKLALKGKSDENATNTKTQPKRRKITDELKGKEEKACCAGELIKFLYDTYHSKLTAVEWDELELYEDNFMGEEFAELRQSSSLFLASVCPKWKKSLQKVQLQPAHPLILVITASALRATQLNRDLCEFKGNDCKVAKLFAKHMKIEDQKGFLSTHVIHIGLGTPHRIHSLLQSGDLHLSSTHKIIIDCSWRDVKLKRLLDIREILEDFVTLLRSHLIPRVKSSSCQFVIL